MPREGAVGGQGQTITTQIMRFWMRLDDDHKQAFLERVFTRIENPAEGRDFNSTTLSFSLSSPKFAGFTERAQDIFVYRRDLKPWQYELALRLARNSRAGYGTPAYVSEQRRMFVTLLDDESEAFARRAIAFKRVYFGATDQEREFFSQRLGLEYLRITGWHRSPNEKVLLEVTRDYRQRATVRLAAIRDEQLRRDAIFIGTENYFPSADSFLMPIRSQFQRTAGLARSQLPRE